MRENTTEVVVGGVVLALALGFLTYAAQATGFSRSGDGYDLRANFRSAEGVSVGTDVRLAGVKIGTVTAMTLNTDTYRAETVFTLQDGILVPDDSAAVVASEGLLGGTFVEIAPGGSFDFFAEGALIEDTQGAVSLISLLMKFVSGSEE
ncbi:outer membrane lipid asymmetry maintenance protein MlaD [Octadecabacter sp. R77987]|uniref:outer membrane lipid asymmetry maintenance protein MlaD n=1 Tax=Octadecabacter sp. R77987 TaxID=3093874 RepID=UPI00366B00DA